MNPVNTTVNALNTTDPAWDLEAQIQHKVELLDQLVSPNTRLTLIGHSIGCKIVTEIVKRNNTLNIAGFP